MIQLLIDNGANIYEKSISGWTPSWCASYRGHTDALQLLKPSWLLRLKKILQSWLLVASTIVA
jgi:hypothetical protein